jgi:AraC family transcriptional regulator
MPLQILERPAFSVVGMHIETRPLSPDIPSLWPRFMSRADEIAHTREPQVSYGVMWQPGGMSAPLHYMAAVSVSSNSAVPAGLESKVIPAGTYAMFSYPLSGLGQGFGEIFNQLLPASEFEQIAGQPLFERYDEAFDPGNPASQVQIAIPVRRRA